MATVAISQDVIDRVARALCANDYVNGPRLWEPDSIEQRWAEQDPERIQYYVALAHAAAAAVVGDSGSSS